MLKRKAEGIENYFNQRVHRKKKLLTVVLMTKAHHLSDVLVAVGEHIAQKLMIILI